MVRNPSVSCPTGGFLRKSQPAMAVSTVFLDVTDVRRLETGDDLAVCAYQNSGEALIFNGGSTATASYLTIEYLGP